uniref:reDPBB_sym4 protein n=1 Tax=synthetic construct TaxID=32630 RepID=UPI001CC331C4|nr:Chain A, reDPBB_sym4 protein [synthetic construct]7DVH_B Chain B, reDPBB_sym4 protein [synthetic construct]7DVH_C Chain C, reDPBB_sym4 protein [synthetic construct]7DVH_D Chain D, reDPBB_sym4 protein [synthetic construct]
GPMPGKSVVARVAPAHPEDVGKGIVRMDKYERQNLGVSVGDYVEVKKAKSVVARVAPAHPEDVGKGIVRMDKYERQNLGVSVGDYVEVKKA